MDTSAQHSNWTALLRWLSTYGTEIQDFRAKLGTSSNNNRFLVAAEDVSQASPIISIPRSALINVETLGQKFRGECVGLTSTQALTLYLARQRTHQQAARLGFPISTFQPYLDTLPDAFPDLPLLWVANALFVTPNHIDVRDSQARGLFRTQCRIHDLPAGDNHPGLRDVMSRSTAHACDKVSLRFADDWQALFHVFVRGEVFVSLSTLLWAWLVVNTRSFWYDLGCKKHDDNITLAPAIDMANHVTQSEVTVVAGPNSLTLYSSDSPSNLQPPASKTCVASSMPQPDGEERTWVRKGEEITFCYGPHGDATLLAEYGFVLEGPNPCDFLDLTESITMRFEDLKEEGETKRAMLQAANYWGDYTAHGTPAHPSYRVLVALRLLHTPLSHASRWQKHVEGKVEGMGTQIEAEVQQTLRQLFHTLGEETLQKVQAIESQPARSLAMSEYSRSCLNKVLRSELALARSWLSGAAKLERDGQV